MTKIPDGTEGESLRKDLGLPEKPEFIQGPPPRPVDLDQIRALHRNQLSAELADEVESLIAGFREWHEADLLVVTELVREKTIDG